MKSPALMEAAFADILGGFALDAAFTVPATGFTGLFGPSGCGKTTVLRAIAGLLRLRAGRFVLGGEVWQDATVFVPPHRRALGYVFQEPSLFPHLSVRGNLLYGTRGRVPLPDGHAPGYDAIVELLGLASLLGRAIDNLSGGERQRVAIGRALLAQPALLLMDEPLSALDRDRRNEVIPFLERLPRELSIPVLYVSHDMREIERLADHLVVMREGRVVASGELPAVQADLSLPLAIDRDATVVLETVVAHYDADYGIATLDAAGGSFLVPMPPVLTGSRRRLVVAASQVSLALERPRDTTVLNVIPARIVSAGPGGRDEVVCVVKLGADGAGDALLVRVTRYSWETLGLGVGMLVHAQVKSAALA